MKASSPIGDVVAAILAHEIDGAVSSLDLAEAAARILGRLDEHTSDVVGAEGCAALRHRAMQHCKAEVPWLATVVLESASSTAAMVRSLAEAADRQGTHSITDCITLLVTFHLDLLASFIGEDLTLRLLQRAWPELPREPAPRKKEELSSS